MKSVALFIIVLSSTVNAEDGRTLYFPALWCNQIQDGSFHSLSNFVLYGKKRSGKEKGYERFARIELNTTHSTEAILKLYFTGQPSSKLLATEVQLKVDEPSHSREWSIFTTEQNIEIYTSNEHSDFPQARYHSPEGKIEHFSCMEADPGPGGGGMSGGN